MRLLLVGSAILLSLMVKAQQKDYSFRVVPFTSVKLTDHFWLPRLEINRKVTIPASFERCEKTGRVDNFVMAAKKAGKFCTKYPFDDTDIYKTIEGASFSLSLFPDPALEHYIDSLITIVGKAQEPDGYLYTARTINPGTVHPWAGKDRWEKERELSHELYNAGHLYEAAAAHFQATGKRNLLNIALKNADLVCSVFGPDKKHVAPGHEVVEMGLVKLYRITGKNEYLSTAKFFIEERGHYSGYDTKSNDPWKNGAYWQDDKPITQQQGAEGHAVRAGYLYAAVADVAALTGDDSLLKAIDRIWENMVKTKMYVQGSVGAVGSGERYGDDYELPNATAYNETCAAIANVYWNHRMFLLHGNSKYIDVLERILYNGLISGIGLDGKSFFYTNAMQITKGYKHGDMEVSRSGWFECSCCPTNLVRLIPSIPGYMYAQKDDQLYVNLFINSTASINMPGAKVQLEQQNNYPWDGQLKFLVNPDKNTSFTMRVRIPGWARKEAVPSDLYHFTTASTQPVVIMVNGQPFTADIQDGYALIKRAWRKGDQVEVLLPMDVQRIGANEKLTDNIGKVTLQRGPLVYCAEWKDNNGRTSNLVVPVNTKFNTRFVPDLLNGVTVLEAEVPAVNVNADGTAVNTVKHKFTAIPYYSWANRGEGEMNVWLPVSVKDVSLITK